MSPPERAQVATPRYGLYAGLFLLLIVGLLILNSLLSKPAGTTGIPPGQRLAPFAVPLALSSLVGDANIATHADQGSAGKVPACSVRGPRVLNICELYERGPVVLALFVDEGSCPQVLSEMQALVPAFPGVRFAAVSIKGDRGSLRRLARSRGLTLPLGIDEDGALATLYKVLTCPQLTLAYPGGVVQSRALLGRPTPAVLRARVSALLAAARARGWRGAGA
jgi:AhpC/TSA family